MKWIDRYFRKKKRSFDILPDQEARDIIEKLVNIKRPIPKPSFFFYTDSGGTNLTGNSHCSDGSLTNPEVYTKIGNTFMTDSKLVRAKQEPIEYKPPTDPIKSNE